MKNNKFSIDYSFEVKEAEEAPDGFFYFSGYGSTRDLDLVNDIVEPTAFNDSLKKKLPVMLWQHDRDIPIGVYTEAVPDSKGLKVRGKMPLDDDFVRGRVVPQMKAGSVAALSIGFRTIKADMDHDKGIRIIKEADLLEISLVTFPANPEAQITALKSWAVPVKYDFNIAEVKADDFAPIDHHWSAEKAAERVDAPEGALNVYDMVEGKKLIVPRAVFALRVAAEQEPEQYENVKDFINKAYKALRLSAPFDGEKAGAYCKTELKNLLTGDLLTVLRYKELSKDAADYVIGALMSFEKRPSPEAEKAFSGLVDRLKNFNEVK